MRISPLSLVRSGLSFTAIQLLAATALQAQTYTVQSISAPAFGTVAAAATGNTTFRNTGSVSVISGSGAYVSGTVTRGFVTIRCADGNGAPRRCNNANNRARVTVETNGSAAGRGQGLTNFSAVAGSGTTLTGTTSGSSLDMVMSGWTANNQDRTFFLDVDLPILGDNASTSTSASSGFRVWADLNPTVPSNGLSADAVSTVRRATTVTKVYDIMFGTIARPATGSGTAAVTFTVTAPDAGTSNRSVGGSSPPGFVPSSSYSGGLFTLNAEPGTIFTLTAPTATTMSGPGGDINVTLTPSLASGSHTMVPGGIGLGYGAEITVTSTTQTGEYSGNVSVSISYN